MKILPAPYTLKCPRIISLILMIQLSLMSGFFTLRASSVNRFRNLEQIPSEELLDMSKRYLESCQFTDSALICLKALTSRVHTPSLTSQEADLISSGFYILGGIYINNYSDFTRATMAFMAANELAAKYGCDLRLAQSDMALATLNLSIPIYDNHKNEGYDKLVDESIARYKNAFNIASESKNYALMGFAAVNAGLIGMETNNLSKCREMLDKVTSTPQIPEWQRLLCRSFIAWQEGNRTEAMELLDSSSHTLSDNGKERIYRLENERIRINMLLSAGERGKARKLGVEIADREMNGQDMAAAYEIYRMLREDAKQNGDTLLARDYELKMLRARLSSPHNDLPAAVAEGKMLYRIETLGDSLVAEGHRVNNLHQMLWLTIFFSSILLIACVALFIKHRQLKNSHRLIVMRDKELLASAPAIPDNEGSSEAESVVDTDQSGDPKEEKGYRLFQKVSEVMTRDPEIFDEEFSAVVLAAKLHERQANISNAIQTFAGKSFNAMLAEARVREACRRMLDREQYANYTVEAIAGSVGYKSRSHFTSVFKKVTGMSPSDYMRQARCSG